MLNKTTKKTPQQANLDRQASHRPSLARPVSLYHQPSLIQQPRTPLVQAKLSLGQANDKYEQEADRVADQVMQMPTGIVPVNRHTTGQGVAQRTSQITPLIQRQEGMEMEEEEEQQQQTLQASPATAAGSTATPNVTAGVNAMQGNGQPLSPATRRFMEPRFGHNFGQVRIHAGSQAAGISRQINARAFTVGSNIAFAAGQYQPHTLNGRRLLAHELTHVVQQKQASDINKEHIQRRGEDENTSSEEGGTTEERLNEIEQSYRSMIADARDDGYDVAADNLERFLAGTGGTKTLEVSWLRGFSAVVDAERTNQERFENSLSNLASGLADGKSETFNDHWDRRLTGSVTEELYYASGTSTITSTGNFTLTRSGDTVTITGTVSHRWWDPYDWHAGLTAYIPGYGSISDADALLLQEQRGAAPFDMESIWEQTVQGEVTLIDYWFDSETFTWSGP